MSHVRVLALAVLTNKAAEIPRLHAFYTNLDLFYNCITIYRMNIESNILESYTYTSTRRCYAATEKDVSLNWLNSRKISHVAPSHSYTQSKVTWLAMAQPDTCLPAI